MSKMNASTSDLNKELLSSKECKAVQILHKDGWTYNELAMVFECSNIGVHIRGECAHG